MAFATSMRRTLRTCGALTLAAGATVLLSCSDTTEPITSGPPASLLVVGGQDQSGVVGKELPTPLRVKVLDQNGNPVRGQVVNFRVTSGGGSVFAGVAITTDSGTAADRWTLGTSVEDPQRVEARAVDQNTGQALVFGTFQATPLPDAPAQVTRVEGDAQTGPAGAPLSDSLGVRVADQFGNPVPGTSVAWAVGAGGGSLSAATSQTNALGLTRVQWTLGTEAGAAQRVTASVGSVAPATFVATAGAGAAAQLIIQTGAAGATVNVPFATQPSIRIADVHGNTVTGAADAVSLSVSGTATVIGTATVSSVNGVASFTNAGLKGPVGTYTLTYGATLGGTLPTVTQQIELTAGAAAKYVVTSSGGVGVTSSVTISAQLSDANDTPVLTAGKTVTWSSTGVSGSFSSQTSTTNANGIATVTFTAGTVAGHATITGTDNSGLTGSQTVDVAPGPPAKLAFVTQPSNVGWRLIITPTVRVAIQDQYSNTITSSTGQVTLAIDANPGGTTLAGGGATPLVNGVASFPNALLDQPGTGYTLRATSSGGLTSEPSVGFDVSAIAIIATAQSVVKSLAIAGSTVYFLSGDIRSVPVTGGASVSVVPAQTLSCMIGPSAVYGGRMIIAGAYVALLRGCGGTNTTATAVVSRFPLGGGPVEVLGANAGTPNDLTFDGTYFYFNYGARPDDGAVPSRDIGVTRIRTTDHAQLKLYAQRITTGSSAPAPAMTLAGGQVYYSGSTGIERVPIDSGAFTTVAAASPSVTGFAWSRMVTDGNRLYYVQSNSLRSVPLSGGAFTNHVNGLSGNAGNMVIDGGYLYLNNEGSLQRYSLVDFSVTHIAPNDDVVDVAVDATAVYWASNGSTPAVKKAPK